MDRGYPSTPAFIHMMDKGIKFIVRLKSSDYKKEQSSLSENDQLGQSDIRSLSGGACTPPDTSKSHPLLIAPRN